MALFSARPPVCHVEALEPGVALVEVNGPLQDAAVGRWTALLNGVIAEGTADVVVDLRGCTAIDAACYSALIQASSKMKVEADGGVRLVTYSGSPAEGELEGAVGELPVHATVQEARMYLEFQQPA